LIFVTPSMSCGQLEKEKEKTGSIISRTRCASIHNHQYWATIL